MPTTNSISLQLEPPRGFSLRRLSIKAEAVVGSGAGDAVDLLAALSLDGPGFSIGLGGWSSDHRGDEEGDDCGEELHFD